MNAAVDYLEAEGSVRTLGRGVVNERVGRHFKTASGSRPCLGRAHQLFANTVAAMLLKNEPPLDKADRAAGVATISV